jgi:hypothetical protein
MRTTPALCLLLLIAFTGSSHCAFAQGFVRLQEEVGLTHIYYPQGHIGGGVVIFDINNDGFMDVFLPGGSGDNVILLNDNGEQFIDITAQTGIGTINNIYTFGGVAGDFNNDGYEDLFITTWRYVTTWGGPNMNVYNVLLINNGNNTFTNGSGLYNVLNPSMSAAATLLDLNHDGYLDIYVANYVNETGFLYDPDNGQLIGFDHDCHDNFLFVSNSGMGYFEQAEVYGVNDNGCGLAAGGVDFNRDGLTDLISVNDFGQWVEPNKLYQQTGTGFSDVSVETGMDIGIYGMGIAIGDYDEDGYMDYYVTNIGRNVLLQHQQDHQWADVTTEAGVENEFTGDKFTTGWGTFFFDYDNNSYLDLYVSNGHIPAASFVANALYDSNKLYRNNQDGTFTDITELENLVDTAMGRGAVVFDFNNDGKLDILQINTYNAQNQAPNGAVLYLNQTQNDNNFVMFHLKGTSVNPNAIGSRVELYFEGRMLVREVDGGSSHASHSDKRIHYGLGEAEQIDSVLIYWPGIAMPQIVYQPAINEIHTIIQHDVVTSVKSDMVQQMKVFPNPSNSVLNLWIEHTSAPVMQITMRDITGKTLFHQETTPQAGDIISLDHWVQQLPPALYTLSVSDGNQFKVFKVVVQR